MANRKLPIISVVPAGTKRHQRWLIADERRRVSTGKGFAESNGLVFASHNLAAIDAENILRNCVTGVVPASYVAPTVIEVFSDEAIPQAVVAHYLSKVTRLYINRREHGHGPEGSLLLMHIDWSRIEPCSGVPEIDRSSD